MKKLIILLLISINCYAQDVNWYAPKYGSGTPAANPSTGALRKFSYIDTLAIPDRGYIWKNNVWTRDDAILNKGADGKDGEQGIQGVKGDTGEQGIQGVPGQNGTGTASFKYYSPQQFYTGNWATAIQTCIDSACTYGFPIYSSGTYNLGTTKLNLPKFFNELTWYGGRIKITCGGITRPRPASLTESQQQQNTKYTIYDIQLFSNGTGIGFEPAANSNSVFYNFQISNFATAAYFRTTQNGDIRNWSINNCVNGIIRDAESINGINPSAAQSNDTECHKIRMHVSNGFNMNICFGIYHSFGCHTYKTEVEGNAKVFRVFDIDNFGNNTVKELIAFEPHFEFTQGFVTGGCFAKVNLNAGVFKLISPNHDVGALAGMILIDASGSGVSALMLVQDVNKWEHSGKIFINTNGSGCRWRLERGLSIIQYSANNNPTVETNIKALFTNPIQWSGENYNQNPKVWGYSTFDWTMF